ncbi:MAG: nucleotidyltransferase domain-containing protein [Armatimonadota bacterium]
MAFGSRVNGTARPDGDLDLIVVPDAFEGIPFLERSRRFNELVPCSRTLPTSRKDSWVGAKLPFRSATVILRAETLA